MTRPPGMADLTGSFSSIHFAPLAQFLADLGKTGDLLISNERWVGQLSLQDGRIVAAGIDDEHGLSALELIVSGVSERGNFEFFDGSATLTAEIDADWDFVGGIQRLSTSPLQGWMSRLRAPTAVPRLVVQPELRDELEITLTRAAIRLFLDVDGQRSIQDLVRRHGVRCCVTTLLRLCDLGLAEIPAEQTAPPGEVRDTGAPPAGPSMGTRLGRFARANTERGLQVGGELVQAAIVAGVLIFAGRTAVENFRVEGISMQPNFSSGQVLVVNRLAYLHVDGSPLEHLLPTTHQGSIDYMFGGPQRGDIAIFDSPVEPGVDYIKRVIGLPGDRVAVHDGRVFVNDAPLAESYIQFAADYRFPTTGEYATVPPDSYFVLGDNRPESLDSHFGWFVPVENLVGRAWVRYWPLADMSVLQSGSPSVNTARAASVGAPDQP
ncbi:MAG: signal peptidase I [Chloroflexi bacterium]|nr:signal peptidase I [Chloroflexota bacterium]